MAEIWYGEGEIKDGGESSCRVARRRRRMELRRMRLVARAHDSCMKRRRLDESSSNETAAAALKKKKESDCHWCPKYGATSICGRRREMEDAVSIHPDFYCYGRDGDGDGDERENYHFFAVFDGHGCSHVAGLSKERMHEIVAQELELLERERERERDRGWWMEAMQRCFSLMDNVAVLSGSNSQKKSYSCSCQMQMPRCHHVGSTAVVAVVGPCQVVVANCGDSRAVLCRNGSAVPLSSDHKPDRPDELQRIEAAGGRVIYWDGARVFGVLAMSRAIGDSYLKPFVICEPEVTVTEITEQDEFLILASDGLWDVVPNELACQVVRRCLQLAASGLDKEEKEEKEKEKACADAAMLLTKLALARGSRDNISVVVVDLRRH